MINNSTKKVLVAMSGGVDSSVAAAILKEQGFDVRGVTMNLFGDGIDTAARDAKLVTEALSIPLHIVDAVDIFERTVISYFINEYKSARTPNPCVVCNRHLKFGLLMDKARELGCDYLATGHYAIIDDGQLKRGVDTRKDQSYFLYPILASYLNKIIFPLGDLTKDEVRSLAQKFNLPTAEKGDSQDICFIPSGNYLDFLASRGIGVDDDGTAGDIVDINGKKLGRHTGIHNFTVGQRKGLGALGKRMYVKSININDNTVVAAEEHELGSNRIMLGGVVTCDRGIYVDKEYSVQIRYRSAPTRARVVWIDGNDINDIISISGINLTMSLKFDAPVKAASPGQSAVIYDGDTVIAGGIIGAGFRPDTVQA